MTKQQNIRCLIKAEVIYQFIQDNNLTKKQFCEKCKISQSTFYRMLSGNNFRISAIFKIAVFMHKKIADLCNIEYLI